VTGNVSQPSRHCGISRQIFYMWLRRYEEQEAECLRDRSSRPHNTPQRKIMYLWAELRRILVWLDLNRLPASQKHKIGQKP
jgi:transposase-like protein